MRDGASEVEHANLPDGIQPCRRFEWERLVRRIRMPMSRKLLCLILATYADQDGTRIKPGVERLITVTGGSDRNVRRMLVELRAMFVIIRVKRGGGRTGQPSEYRLTMPEDALDRFELAPPTEREAARERLRVVKP